MTRLGRLGRLALVVVVAVLAVVVLFTVVFPWVDRHLIADPVMEGSAPGHAGTGEGE